MAKVFNIITSKDEKVTAFYNRAIDELSDFYNLEFTQNYPRLFIVPDRKTFNDLNNGETQDWLVGSTLNSTNVFYILSPEAYETEGNHKYSDEEYSMLIKHELSHLFARYFFNSYIPKWFTEGMAIYTSGQIENRQKPKTFTRFLDSFEKPALGMYDESGFAVEILIKEIGREKFLESIKEIEIPVTKESFEEFFKKNFDIELSYKWFNENL